MRSKVRSAIRGVVVVLLGVACAPPRPSDPVPFTPRLSIEPSPSPYARVTAGPVQAIVPDGWQAVPLDPTTGYRGGFLASPKLEGWARMDGSTAGMAATWVDATEVGAPSDLYYLAATGPLFGTLTRSQHCRPQVRHVLLDRKPGFGAESPSSPGDYVARGKGTCSVGAHPTRWAYFVAAPGFGPVRRLGIPSSGLYVVVAVLPDSERAAPVLQRMIGRARFGGASVREFVTVARRAGVV